MFRGSKIRTKIFWAIFLTVAFSLADAFFLIHYRTEKEILTKYERIAEDDGKDKTHALSLTFSHYKMAATQIAESIPHMNNWKEYLTHKFAIFPEIKDVFVVSRDGRILFNAEKRKNVVRASNKDVTLLFQKIPSETSVVRAENLSFAANSIFVISGLIRLRGDKQPVRVLLNLDIPYIFTSVLGYPDVKNPYTYYLINRQGKILFTADSGIIGKNLSDLSLFKKLSQTTVAEKLRRNSTEPFKVLVREKKWFVFRDRLESGAFGFIGEEDLSPIIRAFQPTGKFLITFFIINLLIVLVVSEILAQHFSSPLRTLVNALGSYQKKKVLPPLEHLKNKKDEYGILTHEILNYIQEIEQKNHEIRNTLDQLKASEERYRLFLNHTPNMVLVVEGEKIIFANKIAALILGFKETSKLADPKKLLFKNLQGRVFPLLDIPAYYKKIPIEGTLQIDDKNLPVLVYNAEFTYRNTRHGLFILVDVSRVRQLEIEEKQMEWKLIESNRLASIGALATGIAHNLNNPLTSIVGFTEMLKMKYPDEPDLNSILRAANQMEKTVLIIMDRRKKEYDSQKQSLQLNEVISDSLQLLDVNTQFRYGLKKAVHLDPNLPPVFGKYGDFSLSLDAILYNAAEAMENCEEKILTVSSRMAKEGIQIEISDTGCGIPPENLEKIFLPFFTTKPDTTTDGTNHNHHIGLGLFITRRLLDAYRAKIDLKSELGKGTTFVITIPVK
ncbi:sporulation kinase E [bacterium BMS3Abin05]|nr:sporulation kinase E [bacterium BMS3Abin05]GBE26460.1 sporulation kinase E [bacterium BMS3Bbin03]